MSPRLLGLQALVALAVALSSSGCGHPASEAECETILERIVDLELKAQKVTDAAEIEKRRRESLGFTGDSGKSEALQGCVGKHITDRALACVRGAETATEITEHCLQ
ncbi:MAG TPA: hypothetical protein VJT73_09610 [Polyangiaceae bacterium]|nr:hypothetical protein [Polyangiaceae bacterium]